MSEDRCEVPVPPRRDGLGDRLREDLWGILVITKREFWANIVSVRSLVMVIILALIMLGASMGFAGLSTQETQKSSIMYQVMALDSDGAVNDLVLFVHEVPSYEPLKDIPCEIQIESLAFPEYAGKTDEHGIFIARNLTPAFHLLHVLVPDEDDGGGFTMGMGISFEEEGGFTYVFVPHNVTVPYPSLGVNAYQADIRGDERLDGVAVHVVGPSGEPVGGATVSIEGDANITNSDGIATFRKVSKGEHLVTATADGLTGLAPINSAHQRTETDPFAIALEGPDQVLSLVSIIAIGLFGPIYAVVLSFDSIFREKLSGSIDYILSRPMGRRAVLTGKFTGILAALMVPITATSMAGVGVIAWRSGENPSGDVVVGFLVYTVFLIAIFVLLQMIFSTMAKTTTTAILSGIALWLFFFLLYDLILVLVVELSDMTGKEAATFYNRAGFANPIGIYSRAVDQLVTGSAGTGIPYWAPAVALVVLTAVLLVLTMEIFRRRVTE